VESLAFLSRLVEDFVRIDRAANLCLREVWSDLPKEYRVTMGPRYGYHNQAEPLSIFRGEGQILYALAKALFPQIIVDAYTGTGYSAICLALGAPGAIVYSFDDYREGARQACGLEAARELITTCGVPNIVLFQGSWSDLDTRLQGRRPELAFLDGEDKDFFLVPPSGLLVVHDEAELLFDASNHLFRVPGGGHLTVKSGEFLQFQKAANLVATLGFPAMLHGAYEYTPQGGGTSRKAVGFASEKFLSSPVQRRKEYRDTRGA
jgi:hypothetical protein